MKVNLDNPYDSCDNNHMDLVLFMKELDRLHSRVDEFCNLAGERIATQPDELLEQALENLQTSIVELLTAEEELKNQNETLLETRQALDEERQRYQDLFDFAPGGYLETDLDGKILEANQSAALMFNQPQKQLQGKVLPILIVKEDRQLFRDRLTRVRRYLEVEGHPRNETADLKITFMPEWEIRFNPRNKNPFQAAISMGILQRGPKKYLRWLIRDVSEQKKAREALQESESRFRTLAETAPLFIVVVQAGVIRYANPAACQLTGYTVGELVGSDPFHIIHPDRRDSLEYQELSNPETPEPAGPGSKRWELRINTRSGQECWIDASTTSLLYNGRPAWVLTGFDITQRLLAERDRRNLLQRLVTAQEEEQRRISLELHDQMGQDMIALILGLKSLETTLPVEAGEHVERLQKIAESLRGKIHRMALDLHPSVIDDLGLAEALATYVEEWSDRNRIRVDIQSNLKKRNEIPAKISIAIYRIVQEALTNVLKHSGAKSVSLILEKRPDHLLTIIEDDGGGFEIDENGQGYQKDKKLGLIGMRERAELVGGSLVMESSPNQGTSLFLRIPFDEKKGGA